MFSAKDRMSYRYFHKRAHYLAVIAKALNEASTSAKSPLSRVRLTWENVMGDARRPVIVLSVGKGMRFRNDQLMYQNTD
jgi:U3 small nucleolar RNA-associated protein 22